MVWKIFTCFAFISAAASQTFPTDQGAKVGADVTFQCRPGTEDFVYITWYEFVTKPNEATLIWHTGGQISDAVKYAVDEGQNKYDLTVRGVQLSQAGRYQCRPILAGSGPAGDKNAELTVVSTPQCPNNNGQLGVNTGSPPMDQAQLTCSVQARGNNNVQLAWYRWNGQLLPSQRIEGANDAVDQNTTFTVRAADDSRGMECRVTVTNVQSYNDKCISSPVFDILYPVPTDIEVQPMDGMGQNKFDVGEHINCSAGGNPVPTYNWQYISGACNQDACKNVSGFRLDMMSAMRGQNVYRCYVENTIRGTIHSVQREVTFTVTGPPNPGETTAGGPPVGAIVGGVIGGLIGLIIIVVLVYFLVIKRPRDKIIRYPTDEDLSVPPNQDRNNLNRGLENSDDKNQLPPDFIDTRLQYDQSQPYDDNQAYDPSMDKNGHRGAQYGNIPPGGFTYNVDPADVQLQQAGAPVAPAGAPPGDAPPPPPSSRDQPPLPARTAPTPNTSDKPDTSV